jgi:glutamate-ammonia-ligase adenylyltransferase
VFWAWKDYGVEAPLHDAQSATANPQSLARLQRLSEGTINQPLPAPLSRQIKAALPAALEHIEHAADPERALSNLERLCDASGNRLSLLRSLAQTPPLARAVFAILGGSQWLSDTLVRFPELLDMAAQRSTLAQPRTNEDARAACRDYCYPFRDKAAALRRWKSREMLRIGLRDLTLDAASPEITREISDLAQACIAFACDEIKAARRPASEAVAFAVLGMGKLGGRELHYRSDADVIFVCDPPRGTDSSTHEHVQEATGWAEALMSFCGARTEDGVAFEIDARLRPDGRSGPLVRTVEGFVDYFERETNGIAVWERQALTRARFVAGDAGTSARLMAAIRHVAFPSQWRAEWGDELRHIKSRVENERAAKGAKAGDVYDVKLGPGCLSDIEFCAQWLALKNGARVPALQTPNTLGQIEAARNAQLLSDEEANALTDTYIFLRRAELRLQITQEQTVKAVKANSKEWTAWARAVFSDETDDSARSRFSEQWQTSTRNARGVMERVRDKL